MKSKLSSIIAGVMALAIATTPAFAQGKPDLRGWVFPALKGITLTEQQKEQLNQIIDKTLLEGKSVLTQEQRQQVRTYLQEGEKLREILPKLNLSRKQRKQLREEMKLARTQVSQLLTPEQKQQFQKNIDRTRNPQQRLLR